MTPAKEKAIMVAAERLKLARMILNNASMAPAGGDGVEVAYQLARAEFNEALAEVNRVTDASFQPEDK